MKVILVNPPGGLSDETAGMSPPLGLAYIASLLETQGVEVKIVDMKILGLKPIEIAKYLKGESEVLVGISTTMTACFPEAIEISKVVKQVDKNIPVILGGNHATFTHREILQHYNSVDIVVLFEGEQTMLDLMKAVEGKSDLKYVKGIAYRDRAENIIVTSPRGRIEKLDELPIPARHLLPIESYNKRAATIVTSRGCPYSCIFCSTSAFHGHRLRFHSPKRIANEIEYLVSEYKSDRIIFADDILTYNRKHIVKTCEEIVRRNLKITWGCNTRADYIDRSLLNTVYRAGCTRIFFGIESGSQAILDRCKKHLDLRKARKAIELTKSTGIKATTSFILGLPGEDWSTIEATLNFILEADTSQINVNILVPYPGTRICEDPNQYGIRILSKDWHYYTHTIPIIETEHLSQKDLIRGKLKIMREFYRYKTGKDIEELKPLEVIVE